MFEDITYDVILDRVLDRVSDEMDKRQGSVIYDAVAPACAELAQLYIEMDRLVNETFADTASREYLIKRAAERGIVPYKGTCAAVLAELKGKFDISKGFRFLCDDLVFVYSGEMEGEYYKLICTKEGEDGNISFGELLPIDSITGLESAYIVSIFIRGRNEEETEVFRKRYFDSFSSQAFGGNRADYIEKLMLLNDDTEIYKNGGIGGCNVYRTPKGGGTVKVVIATSNFMTPTDKLIELVQNAVDPHEESGEGNGFAPIGHFVEIEGVNEVPINISFDITLIESYTIDDVYGYIINEIDDYLFEQRKLFGSGKDIIIRRINIETRLISIPGIINITSTLINGIDDTYILESDSVPVRGDVNAY